MSKSKHSFQKRQREKNKQKKREEKLQRKIDKKFQSTATFEEMIADPEELQPDNGVDASGIEEEKQDEKEKN